MPLDYMDAAAVTPRIAEQTVATKSSKTCVPSLGQTVFARELRRVMDRCYLEPVGYLRDFHERRLPPASEAAAAATVLRNAASVVDAGWCQGAAAILPTGETIADIAEASWLRLSPGVRICGEAALGHAARDRPRRVYSTAAVALHLEVHARMGRCIRALAFNDHVETTGETVAAALRSAAAVLDGTAPG